MDNLRLLEIFDQAMLRAETTIKPVNGWFEKLQNHFHYRFRVETADLMEFQKYYDKGKYVGCIFDFTDDEKQEITDIIGIVFDNANGFYISPNTTIYPHTDNSPKRSQKSTIINLTGQGSVLKLYSNEGDVVFELPEMIRKYTLFPKKIIHGYDVYDQPAKLINIWHD